MKSTFDKPTRDELINRINSIPEDSKAQWGKMNLYQVLKHCTMWEEMVAGKIQCKRVFIGRIIGKWALNKALKAEQPMMRNAPTSPELKVTETNGDIVAEKKKWIALINQNANYPGPYFIHPFFGQMTKEQLGYHAYMHTDHHLRQFNS